MHKEKKKLQWDDKRDPIMIKSNPLPTGWVIHKLEINNTKRSSATFVKVLSPMSGFPAQGSDKRTGNLTLMASEIWL